MIDQNNRSPLGELIKSKLKQHAYSLRKFSEMTAVDTATISRIINGKRKATPEHLQRFAECLQVPVSDLFLAAGYPVDAQQTELQSSVSDIQDILASFNLNTQSYSLANVEHELSKYELFSQTEEGQATILNKFQEKLTKAGSTGPYIQFLKDMHEKFRTNKGTWFERALIGSALIYFIIPTDCIPDYIFPLGYIDDAIAVNYVVQKLHLRNSSLI
ncbi:DUF1232 domain-containing protein [Paenibacillus paeoniae]|uniref:DUF1232 domain-containing protein n=1 Tax=Paenibacillus paeoniae TaxID=2292705 RepID=A0A371P7J3_9BACL|nr:DUF1232 domain-containing protein [Paenibacillus paeoniae]REK71508.1 DUF1232 domain-containing protein [Paenibacillus paeoniae]